MLMNMLQHVKRISYFGTNRVPHMQFHCSSPNNGFAPREVHFGYEVRQKLLAGINTLADAVAASMGPKGRWIIIDQGNQMKPLITKDGFEISKSIELEDKTMNMGAKLLMDAAKKTSINAGDGTSTATVLARSIIEHSFPLVDKGANPHELFRGMRIAVGAIEKHLQGLSEEVDLYDQVPMVATIAAGGDKNIGQLVSSAFEKVGDRGRVRVRPGNTAEDKLEYTQGVQIEAGFVSPAFINTDCRKVSFQEETLILLTAGKFQRVKDLVPAMEIALQENKPLLIIADGFDNSVLNLMILNRLRGLKVCAIKNRGHGETKEETLKDLAAITGGECFGLLGSPYSVEKIKLSDFGRAEDVTVSAHETLLLDTNEDEERVKKRIDALEDAMDRAKNNFDLGKLKDRYALLKQGVALLYAGGNSEIEVQEKKARIENSVNTTRAAIVEGIVPGGGVSYMSAIPILNNLKVSSDEQGLGVEVLKYALVAPLRTVVENAGEDSSIIAYKILEQISNDQIIGFDVTSCSYKDMVEEGIIDATKVLRMALLYGCGVASVLTGTEAVINIAPDQPVKSKKAEEIAPPAPKWKSAYYL